MRLNKTTVTVRLECDFCGAVHEVAEEHLATADLPWLIVKIETVTDEHIVEWVVCPTCMDTHQVEYMHEPPTVWDMLKAAKVEGALSRDNWLHMERRMVPPAPVASKQSGPVGIAREDPIFRSRAGEEPTDHDLF